MKKDTTVVGKITEKKLALLNQLKIPNHWVLNRIILVFFLSFLFFEVIIRLAHAEFLKIPEQLLSVLVGLEVAIIVLLVASAIIRLTEDWIFKIFSRSGDVEQTLFLKKLYEFTIYFLALGYVLFTIGVTTANIALFGGLLATGFAFAIREVIISYMVWLMLLTKKPFRIGDYLKIGDETGKVIHIGTFYVVIDADIEVDSEITKIPNKLFLEKPIQNLGSDGIMLDTLKIPQEKLPNNPEKYLETARKMVAKIVQGKTTITFDIVDGKTQLVIKYPVSVLQRSEIRSMILLKIR